MKALVIYDSNFGNTQKIAEAIAGELGTQATAVSIKDFKMDALSDCKVLIVGSPINGWLPTPRVSDFLKKLAPARLNGISAAAFDTRMDVFYSGNAAKKISKLLKVAGANIRMVPVPFFVKDKKGPLLDGEIGRAKNWARGFLPLLK